MSSDLDGSQTDVYQKAHKHWSTVSSDEHGMLGGAKQLHKPDIQASTAFIRNLVKKGRLRRQRLALDCGSGIGRVTKHLLLPLFDRVDMVDFSSAFISQAENYIEPEDFKRVGECFVESLHTFTPCEGKYDLVWIQWVSGHLTDGDLVAFFERCSRALADGGCVVLKENLVTKSDEPDFDMEDNSWTRPRSLLLDIFQQAGLHLVSERRQLHFPKGFYEVRMMALSPEMINNDGSKSMK